jgi:hypothetical protein
MLENTYITRSEGSERGKEKTGGLKKKKTWNPRKNTAASFLFAAQIPDSLYVDHPYSRNPKSKKLQNLKLFEDPHNATSRKLHIRCVTVTNT